jgi:hypothetical protein
MPCVGTCSSYLAVCDLLREVQERTSQVAGLGLTSINKGMVVLNNLQSWIGG